MCFEPINNKELTSFSLRDFPSSSRPVCNILPSWNVPSRCILLNVHSLSWKLCKVKSSSSAFFLKNKQFSFVTAFSRISCWSYSNAFSCCSKNISSPAPEHTWMRCFPNPRQLNSVLLVSTVRLWRTRIIQINLFAYINPEASHTVSFLPIIIAFSKPKCKQAKLYYFCGVWNSLSKYIHSRTNHRNKPAWVRFKVKFLNE